MEAPVKTKPVIKENHKQRAYLNSVTSILDHVIKQVMGFVVSPIIVNGLGSTFYGVYQILLEMTGYADMADIQTAQVLKWTVAQKRDVASEEELRGEVTTALVLTLMILPFIFLIGGILIWYAPILTNVSEEYYNLVRAASAIMIFSMVIYKLMDLFESVLRGMNLGFKGMGARSVLMIFSGLLKIWVIYEGYGLIGISIVQVFIGIFTSLVFYWLVKKNIPWFGFGKTDMNKIKSYAKLSGWFMATMIFSMVLFNSEKIILGYLVGPEMVTRYVLTLFASSAMGGLINAVISGVVPGIGNFFGKGEFEKILTSKRLIHSMIWWFAFSIGTCILLFNQSFLKLWVGQGNYAGNMENLFILLIALQYIFFGASGSFINVTLDLKTKVLLTGFSALISIGLAFLLVGEFQILGLCTSVLAGRMVLTIGFPMILKKKINDQTSFFSIENIRPLFVTSMALITASYLQEMVTLSSWLELISWGFMLVMVLMPLFWVLGFNKEQRKILIANLSKIKIFKINES